MENQLRLVNHQGSSGATPSPDSPKMYDEFYGLVTLPFQLIPDESFFFESSVHRGAMAYLAYGLRHSGGLIVITGEVGAGKTILVDKLLSDIDPDSFVISKMVTTQVVGDDFLRLVAGGFGIAQEGLAKGSLLLRISDFLFMQQHNGKRPLLIVDEAQHLSIEALEDLRMLSNFAGDKTKVLQSLLLGQPHLRVLLGSPKLEQLRQRVTAAYHLGPLNEAETRGYVEHRLRHANWRGDPQITEDCFPLIYQHTGGLPRRINTLCSRLFLFGFLEELHIFTESTVRKVARDLRDEIAAVTVDPDYMGSPASRDRRVESSNTAFASKIEHTSRNLGHGSTTRADRARDVFLLVCWWLIPFLGMLGIACFLLYERTTRAPVTTTFSTFPVAPMPPPLALTSPAPALVSDLIPPPKAISPAPKPKTPKRPNKKRH